MLRQYLSELLKRWACRLDPKGHAYHPDDIEIDLKNPLNVTMYCLYCNNKRTVHFEDLNSDFKKSYKALMEVKDDDNEESFS